MNNIKRALLIVFSSILIFAILWFNWSVCESLWIFPNDIFGTYYETPLPNHNNLIIGHLSYGTITNKDDDVLVNKAKALQVVGDYVVGRDSTHFFSLNTLTQEVRFYDSESQMKDSLGIDLRSMYEPREFYWKHRKPYDILADIVIGLISLGLAFYITKQRKSKHSTIILTASTLVCGVLGCYVTIVESIRLFSLLQREDAHSIVFDWHIIFLVSGVLLILATILRWSRKRCIGKAVNIFLFLFTFFFTLAIGVSTFDDGHWRMIDLLVIVPLTVVGFLLSVLSISRSYPQDSHKETTSVIK